MTNAPKRASAAERDPAIVLKERGEVPVARTQQVPCQGDSRACTRVADNRPYTRNRYHARGRAAPCTRVADNRPYTRNRYPDMENRTCTAGIDEMCSIIGVDLSPEQAS